MTIADLDYHASVLDIMELDYNSVMVIHGGGVYGDKHPSKVYGGGTLAESQYFRFYNGITSYCKKIGDPENDYIEKLIEKGERHRL